MKYDPAYHHRHSNRLAGYDYTQSGLYFITLCTIDRQCLFGIIDKGIMHLNPLGEIAKSEWTRSQEIRSEIEIHDFIIMPNHIHGIVEIIDTPNKQSHHETCRGDRPVALNNIMDAPNDLPVAQNNKKEFELNEIKNGRPPVAPTAHQQQYPRPKGPRPKSLGAFVGGYKSSVTIKINAFWNARHIPVWQRNFHDHIIPNQTSFDKIRHYMQTNPATWQKDCFFRE